MQWGGLMTKEDKAQQQIDDDNEFNPYVDRTGYRGTGLTKWEWDERRADESEE